MNDYRILNQAVSGGASPLSLIAPTLTAPFSSACSAPHFDGTQTECALPTQPTTCLGEADAALGEIRESVCVRDLALRVRSDRLPSTA